MIFEHFAINVVDVAAIVSWYTANLNVKVASAQKEPPYMTFLADSGGRVFIELYHRPDEAITDFQKQHFLTFHLAMVSDDAESDKNRLLAEGASFVEEVFKDDGSHLVMLRDPWGIPLQLCERSTKF
ncbi:VOC family protein [Pseudozobellia thermophila]|uniref:Glyoxalase/Bleomycin resistance protein/Dioxygenase superfamily protein n=1 Tax=Pseudozobellia thermophila TaxID=192903 RepID=A0A1M6CSM5_9FLAO|nr:VOC family protein [Pseudozobellia thermophila]SHI63861.1 Glyoxalase/Bleomycin resistance protein/Dioxygenase superfamily protein [Pseudozobellia thermophila]